jgi:hypothetical protein
MTTTRCFRHIRWIANCPDCTAWHLARVQHRAGSAAVQRASAAAAA